MIPIRRPVSAAFDVGFYGAGDVIRWFESGGTFTIFGTRFPFSLCPQCLEHMTREMLHLKRAG